MKPNSYFYLSVLIIMVCTVVGCTGKVHTENNEPDQDTESLIYPVSRDTLTLSNGCYMVRIDGKGPMNSAFWVYDKDARRIFACANPDADQHMVYYRFWYTGNRLDSIQTGRIYNDYEDNGQPSQLVPAIEGKLPFIGTEVFDFGKMDTFVFEYDRQGEIETVRSPYTRKYVTSGDEGQLTWTLKAHEDFWGSDTRGGNYYLLFEVLPLPGRLAGDYALYEGFHPIYKVTLKGTESYGTEDFSRQATFDGRMFNRYNEHILSFDYYHLGEDTTVLQTDNYFHEESNTLYWNKDGLYRSVLVSQKGRKTEDSRYHLEDGVYTVEVETMDRDTGSRERSTRRVSSDDFWYSRPGGGPLNLMPDMYDSYGYKHWICPVVSNEGYIEINREKFLYENFSFQKLLMEYVAAGSPAHIRRLAEHIDYPLKLKYPMFDIEDEDDFVQNYSILFDDSIANVFASMPVGHWSEMGWRGIMFLNGEFWCDGNLLTAVNYESDARAKRWREMVGKDSATVHPDYRRFVEPETAIEFEDGSYFGRIDLVTDYDVTLDNLPEYRLLLYRRGMPKSDKALLRLIGHKQVEGSAGVVSYSFYNEDTSILLTPNFSVDNNCHYMLDGDNEFSKDGKEVFVREVHWLDRE